MPSSVKPITNRVSRFELPGKHQSRYCTNVQTAYTSGAICHPRGRSFCACGELAKTRVAPHKAPLKVIHFSTDTAVFASKEFLNTSCSKNQMDMISRRNLSRECIVSTNQNVSTKLKDVSESSTFRELHHHFCSQVVLLVVLLLVLLVLLLVLAVL